MLKSILKLDGVQSIKKNQQKNILGGSATELAHHDDREGGVNCHCGGTTHYAEDCSWCGWICGSDFHRCSPA
ncbi:hypothetical protein [Aquimarina sp. 2201CG5-10]|uniref:hypothetical protein n=1 Tax=Aquimarina callyspongiae TaxID=3098150 RepID=UPI002AB48FA2|nr:hypothetical protein [Aquimarina sp. 2201CG5-10]MDY8136938.1 hypothetical protein [Aquimarina sp. 2201CG5-10]